MQEISFVKTTKPIVDFTKKIIANEQRNLNLKKVLNQQLQLVASGQEAGANVNELGYNVRSLIQNWATDNEKQLKQKYENLLRPQTGEFSILTKQTAMDLPELVRVDAVEKYEKQNTEIPKEFLTSYKISINELLTNNFEADILYFQKTLVLLEKNIFETISPKIEIKNFDFRSPRDLKDNYIQILNNYSIFLKEYQGELNKEGIMEYFVQIRDYTGLIMVVVGVFSPILLVANNDLIDGNLADFFKGIKSLVNLATSVSAFILIIYGYFKIKERIPKQRIEDNTKEMNKAREYLLNEGRRSFTDSAKEWQNKLFGIFREISIYMQQQVEQTLKNHSISSQQNIVKDKATIQRTNQGIDLALKNILNTEKYLDSILKQYEEEFQTLKKNLQS